MRFLSSFIVLAALVISGCEAGGGAIAQRSDDPSPRLEDFESLFNGEDFSGWRVPEGDGGHWQIIDGVIDYDALSEAEGDKSLWTEEEFGDYILRVDWRLKEVGPYTNPNVPIIMADGSHKRDENGNAIRMAVPDSDSGVLPRGHQKGQANIWNWPIGSGEVYGYRTDQNMPAEVRAAATPLVNADNDIGHWNTFEITMRGQHMTVDLNGQRVIDNIHLTEVPERGPIGLQHHGAMRDGEWVSPPALVQFRNIYVHRLD